MTGFQRVLLEFVLGISIRFSYLYVNNQVGYSPRSCLFRHLQTTNFLLIIMKPHFVAVPFFDDLAAQDLKYVDILTYLTIRSFNDIFNNSNPSVEEITLKMDASQKSTQKSINRLLKAKRVILDNEYQFPNCHSYLMMPVELIGLNLSKHEKAILMLLNQHCLTSHHDLDPSPRVVCEGSGISPVEFFTHVFKLMDKKYVGIKGASGNEFTHLTNAINWIDPSGHNDSIIDLFRDHLAGLQ